MDPSGDVVVTIKLDSEARVTETTGRPFEESDRRGAGRERPHGGRGRDQRGKDIHQEIFFNKDGSTVNTTQGKNMVYKQNIYMINIFDILNRRFETETKRRLL